ncbi:MAG TPA: type II toxin-antitoxin system RelE/ParE family toxin [Candidatus Peribacteraceae bacterium]|nr:type II toxin-antitoxin system RelE/ParE family toxin [Candidatus Peribacteraceae bacterium]
MTCSLHPGAEHDIASALDFYKEQAGLVVAERFLEEFERVAKFLVEYPCLGTPTTKGREHSR